MKGNKVVAFVMRTNAQLHKAGYSSRNQKFQDANKLQNHTGNEDGFQGHTEKFM